jgi:hypothetical protein
LLQVVVAVEEVAPRQFAEVQQTVIMVRKVVQLSVLLVVVEHKLQVVQVVLHGRELLLEVHQAH